MGGASKKGFEKRCQEPFPGHGSCHAFEVGADNALHAVDFRMLQQRVDLSGVPLHEFLKSLDRRVRTDPIAKLEAVDCGLGGRGDGNLRAFDAVMLDTIGQVRPSHMDKSDGHSAADRPPLVGRNGHPHLERVLGGEPVEAEGGEQADHASGHLANGPSEVVPDVWAGIRQRINPTGHRSDSALLDELCEHRSRHAGGRGKAARYKCRPLRPKSCFSRVGGNRRCLSLSASK